MAAPVGFLLMDVRSMMQDAQMQSPAWAQEAL